MKLNVACAQTAVDVFNPAANLQRAGRVVERAARRGVELVLFPEYLTTGLVFDRRLSQFAESISDGLTVQEFKRLSTKHGCWLGVGVVERDGNRCHNSLLLVSPTGQAWTYRKRYLAFLEHLYFHRGQNVGIFETALGRVGVMICWDMIHRKLEQEMAGQIDLLLICSAWPNVRAANIPLPGLRNWLSRPPRVQPTRLARSLEVPVVFCNMAGTWETPLPGLPLTFRAPWSGNSAVIRADGHILNDAPSAEEALVCAQIDLPGRSAVAA